MAFVDIPKGIYSVPKDVCLCCKIFHKAETLLGLAEVSLERLFTQKAEALL